MLYVFEHILKEIWELEATTVDREQMVTHMCPLVCTRHSDKLLYCVRAVSLDYVRSKSIIILGKHYVRRWYKSASGPEVNDY